MGTVLDGVAPRQKKKENPFFFLACERGPVFLAAHATSAFNEKPIGHFRDCAVSTGPCAGLVPHACMLCTCCTIDTESEAKRNNIISELATFRITKAKAKLQFGVKYLCGHKCERSSVRLTSIRKRKRRDIYGELISL